MSSALLNRLLLVALAGSLVWIWLLKRQIDAQAVQTARLSAELTTERKRVSDTEEKLVGARSRPVAITAPAPPPEVRKETAQAAPERRPGVPGGMLDNPAMQTMMATATKSSLDQRYGMLFRKLKLAPAQLERLKQLLTDRQMNSLDVVRAGQKEGLGTDEINALLASAGTEADASIHTLLGDAGYTQLQDYEQNIGAYGVLDNVERRLGFTSAPLSEKQSAEVLRIIAETSESATPARMADDPMFRVMQGMGGGPSMMNALTQPRITDKTIEAAKTVLQDSQLEVLRQLQTEQQTQLDGLRAVGGPFRP